MIFQVNLLSTYIIPRHLIHGTFLRRVPSNITSTGEFSMQGIAGKHILRFSLVKTQYTNII